MGKIATWQLLAALVGSAIVSLQAAVQAYSFLIGCLIQIAGSAYFGYQAYKYAGARQVHRLVQAMYLGETGKIILAVAGFGAAFAVIRPLSITMVFTGYVAMTVLHFGLASRWLNTQKYGTQRK